MISVLTNLVITMKKPSYKQKLYDKEKRRQDAIDRMNPAQKKSYLKNLLNRSQRRNEVKKQIFEVLFTEDNLAIADIQRKLGLNRNTFNYWIDKFEKEGWIKRKSLKLEGKEARGRPKTLVLNKKLIKEREQYSAKKWKSNEDYMLKSMICTKILDEIEWRKPGDIQHEKLVRLFREFKLEGYGARMITLLHGDYFKINYNLTLTEKGKAFRRKNKSRKSS